MDNRTITHDEFIAKKTEYPAERHIPIASLSLRYNDDQPAISRSVTHDDFGEKHAEYQSPRSKHWKTESSFTLGTDEERSHFNG